MVSHARVLGSVAVLVTAMAGTTCKVLNEDHCANQDIRGNVFCRDLNPATPYCSPCAREYHGCVDYEPFACGGYDNEIGNTQDDGSTATDDSSGSGDPGSSGSSG